MDITVILLLFALYVIPEILRRMRKPKTYKYPEFPPEVPQREEPPVTVPEKKRQPFSSQPGIPAATIVAPAVTTPVEPVLAKPAPAIQPLPADEPVVFGPLAYGLVMAEILGPPRSKANRGRR